MALITKITNLKTVRVLVVDDSRLQCDLLASGFSQDLDLLVVGVAHSGLEALSMVPQVHPDVVLMDLQMPNLDGLETSRAILKNHSIPIVLMTSSARANNPEFVQQALRNGILAVCEKPFITLDGGFIIEPMCELLKGMSQVKLIQKHRRTGITPDLTENGGVSTGLPRWPKGQFQVIAIASSTGGPQILCQILSQLPAHFPVPILVVQHIAPGFVSSLVDYLRPQCVLPVDIAKVGSRLERGIWLAGDDQNHLVVQGNVLGQSNEAPIKGHRPSGTVLFRSLAKARGSCTLGIVLTGMGEDGAVGLQELKHAGGGVLAQDEKSALIHSMPAAAIKLGIVDAVLNPDQIANVLLSLI
jgi:two-component system, chemotaxis family, protein-glutamate methylesterase/glutaminase